jgi:hypothetical protein
MATGGIDFSRTFGANSNTGSNARSGAGNNEQPKAQFWLNIGYTAPGAGKDGEDRFVSLPMGMPLDTMEPAKLQGRDENYRQFTQARNDLHTQIMEAVSKLAPGDATTLNLEIQVRRVSDEQAVPVAGDNPFALKAPIVA